MFLSWIFAMRKMGDQHEKHKKIMSKKKATPNWATLAKKALHTAFVNIIGQLCMSSLFCFEPYFGRGFFF